MARISKHAHKKPKIAALIREGATYEALSATFCKGKNPIPPGTLHGWYRAISAELAAIRNDSESVLNKPEKAALTNPSEQNTRPDEDTAIAVQATVVTPSNVVQFPGGEAMGSTGIPGEDVDPRSLSDFELARRSIREVLLQPGVQHGVKVMAANSLLGAIKLRASTPRHILHDEETAALQQKVADYEALPPEELERRFKESLG